MNFILFIIAEAVFSTGFFNLGNLMFSSMVYSTTKFISYTDVYTEVVTFSKCFQAECEILFELIWSTLTKSNVNKKAHCGSQMLPWNMYGWWAPELRSVSSLLYITVIVSSRFYLDLPFRKHPSLFAWWYSSSAFLCGCYGLSFHTWMEWDCIHLPSVSLLWIVNIILLQLHFH